MGDRRARFRTSFGATFASREACYPFFMSFIQHTSASASALLNPSIRAVQTSELESTLAFARARKGNTRLPTALSNYPDPSTTDQDLQYRAAFFVRRD